MRTSHFYEDEDLADDEARHARDLTNRVRNIIDDLKDNSACFENSKCRSEWASGPDVNIRTIDSINKFYRNTLIDLEQLIESLEPLGDCLDILNGFLEEIDD